MKIHLTTIKDKPLTNMTFDTTTKIATFDFKGGTNSIDGIASDKQQVYFDGSNIVIKSDAAEAALYNIQGMLITTLPIVNGEATYTPTSRGMYIVKCGNNSVKVNI